MKGFDLYRCVLLGVRVPDFVVVPTNAHVPDGEERMATRLRKSCLRPSGPSEV